MKISDADFMNGNYSFERGGSTGSILNQGNITAADGGYIALLAPEVRNEGILSAKLGTVAIGAGDKATLDFNGDSLIGITVEPAAINAFIENKHLIQADGGRVIMSASAANSLLSSIVSNQGVIQARTIENRSGVILLLAGMESGGVVKVGGTLDASAPNGGDGGFIETSANKVEINDHVVTTFAPYGKTGTWLIDPNDFTIAASGGDITGSDLSTDLGNTDVTIDTATQGTPAGNGDIFVNDAVSWSANTTLTLEAERNIDVNASITATGDTAGLTLTPNTGLGGGTVSQTAPITVATLTLNGTDGNHDLSTQNNDVATLAGNTGTVNLRDDNGFEVGTLTTTGNTTLSSTGAVTQTAAITAAGLELLGTDGNYTLTDSGNSITTLAADTGTVNYSQDNSLTIGTVNTTSGITASNTVLVQTTGIGSDITLDDAVSANGTGDAIVLAAGQDFINNEWYPKECHTRWKL